MFTLISLGKMEVCSVGWQRRIAPAINSSGEKLNPYCNLVELLAEELFATKAGIVFDFFGTRDLAIHVSYRFSFSQGISSGLSTAN